MKLSTLDSGYKWLTVEVWFLIALGGGVRAMNAGLACPDWPLCFGDFIPDYHPQVYFEFIHRVLAGVVAIATFVLAWGVYRRRKELPSAVKGLAVLSLVLIVAQVIMGGLTVLLQLKEKVVTAHLALGASFILNLLWLRWSLRERLAPRVVRQASSSRGVALALLTSAMVFVQILLGGAVASHYAALACVDFPTCLGQWIPTLSGPVGLQVIHRLGAYATFLMILIFFLSARLRSEHLELRRLSSWLLLLVSLQMGIGIANVKLWTPPLITVLHLATGVSILMLSVRAVFVARRDLKLKQPVSSPAAYPAGSSVPLA